METVDKNEGALNACVKKMIERSVVAEHACMGVPPPDLL